MFSWLETPIANADFDALHRQMTDISWDVCYCSVFDECYVRKTNGSKPEPVKECKAPPVAFAPKMRDD